MGELINTCLPGHRDRPGHAVVVRRFAVAALFCSTSASSAFGWLSLTAVTEFTKTFFDISDFGVNMVSLMFLVLYLPGSVLSLYATERFGMKANLMIGMFLNLVMTWLKYCATALNNQASAYMLLIIGQTAGAIGQPLILNSAVRVSSDWFPESESSAATIVLTMANIVGQMGGSFVPPFVVHATTDLKALMWWQIIPCAVTLLLAAVVLQDRPEHPPSASIALAWQRQDSRQSAATSTQSLVHAWRDVKSLLANRSFLILATGFGIATSMAWALLTVEGTFVTNCRFSNKVAGNAGAALLGVGTLAAFLFEPVMRSTRAYVELQKAVTWGSALASLLVLAANRPGPPSLVIGAWAVFGAFVQPLMPLSLELAYELSYPVPADVSTGILMTLANLVGAGLILACTSLLQAKDSVNCTTVLTPVAYFIGITMVMGAIVTMFVKKDYRRMRAEGSGTVDR